MSFTIALAGNPNCGKTTLFNRLTGASARTGNWPGVTVERLQGRANLGGLEVTVTDLPGIYALSPFSPEEHIARDFLLGEEVDLILNIVDATQLERSLYLTTQLMEIGKPMVVALTMSDILEKRGENLNLPALRGILGLPLLLISPMRPATLPLLGPAISGRLGKPAPARTVLSATPLGRQFESRRAALERANVPHPLFWAVQGAADLQECPPQVRAALPPSPSDMAEAIADARYRFITGALASVRPPASRRADSLSKKIDGILTHRILGIPLFFAIMLLIFQLTFAPTLFALPIPGPGAFLKELAVAGIARMGQGAEDLLLPMGAPPWAVGLFTRGVIGGVGAVLSFLPQIMVLFLCLSLLEDSGYMARAAFLMDRPLRKFGLSGKAFIPMLMGFGCSVPALMATRTLENESDRRIASLLIPYMSCGAKLPLYALMGGALFPRAAGLAAPLMYLLGTLTALFTGYILRKTVYQRDESTFILEMPEYKVPCALPLLMHLWQKVKGYLSRAGTTLLLCAMAVWALSAFTPRFELTGSAGQSMLGVLGKFLQPLFAPLGFALGPEGWMPVVALLTGLIAREMTVTTLGVLYGAGLPALSLSVAARFSPGAGAAFLVFHLLSPPCMAALAAFHGQSGSARFTAKALALWFGTAYLLSFAAWRLFALL